MSKSIRIPSIAKIAAKLETMMDASRRFGESALDVKDAQLALGSLLLACHDAIDALAAIGGKATLEDMAEASAAASMEALRDSLAMAVPPISGGAPGDFEVIDSAVYSEGWPAYRDADLDGYAWAPTFDGPTPLDVLAMDDMEPERTDADWDAYAALSLGVDEMDHVAAVGCC